MSDKQFWPAPERNKGPIVEQLLRALPERGLVLEIGSGSGQHAAYFAKQLAEWTWQPSDYDEENRRSIDAYVRDAALPNLRDALDLDVTRDDWGIDRADAVFNANTIHIAPWSVCEHLLRGVGRILEPRGLFVLYGPFRIGGAHTSRSNAEFDERLRGRDPSWGVRDLEAVRQEAAGAGLALVERVQMPANNQLIVFAKHGTLGSPRLRYEPATADDAEALQRLAGDEHVRRYLFDGESMGRDWVAAAIESSNACFREHGVGLWLVFSTDAAPIGFCGFHSFDELGPEPQLLYALVESATGRGYATEIARGLVAAARGAGMARIVSAVDEPNTASIRVLDKVGFDRVGSTPGAFGDIVLFELKHRPR